MDISDLRPTERIVEILHPATGAELGIRVSLMSINDDRLKKIKKSFLDERLRLEARGKSFKADDIEDNRDALIVQSMTGWEWRDNAIFNGEKPTFSPAKIREVLNTLPWFREQLEEAVGDEKAFFTI